MVSTPYTLEQAQQDIATAQGQIAILGESRIIQDTVPFTGTPVVPASGGLVDFSSQGHLKYASSDSNAYNTGRLTIVLPSSSSTPLTTAITTPTAGGVSLSVPVLAIEYNFRAWIIFKGSAASAGALGFATSGPANSLCLVSWKNTPNGNTVVPGAAIGQASLGLAPFNSFTLSTTTLQMMEMEAIVNFTATGTFALTVQNSVAADNATIGAASYLQVSPIT